ncbi:unnamed protein product [Allacma fusca]|uniref:Uncharacterized protein n=2 Tax=Allacma fusca TaxID=39272 RepID=A0A8J2NTC8_9HEXA|nr:unnamed protein product [Allacma fusca]
MKSFQLFRITVVAVVLLATVVSGFFDGVNKEVTCKGEKVQHNDKFNKNMIDCIAEFKTAKSNKMAGERKRGKTCIAICALTKDGLFDDKGVFMQSKMLSNIDESLPKKELATTLKAEITKCAETHNMTTVTSDPTDYICASHKEFLQCTMLSWMQTCIEGFDAEIWKE